MKFPVSITYADTNETLEIKDHRMVFQLADVLNKMNGNNSKYAINFIEWIENSPNVPILTSKRLPDGTVPGAAIAAANPALQDNVTETYSNVTAVAEAQAAYNAWHSVDRAKIKEIVANMFVAHKEAIEDDWFDYSEWGFLRYKLGIDLNITDQVSSISYIYDSWPYDDVYFAATKWRTIDQGLSRLPKAFEPSVLNRTIFNTVVQELSYNETSKKVSVKWRPGDPFETTPKSTDFDYVIVAVPFSRVRLWRLPKYTSLLTRAINTLNYEQACKVALHYKTRFWEHLEYPILGGCGKTDIPGIGSICYPSYKINSSGPGVILASYISGAPARSVGSLAENEHVALVQRAMIEVHGQIAQDQFTGAYDRMCWENNEFQTGAWCSPFPQQQNLYLPAYFHTEKHTVFVGEHTSYTHAWIWSALESAVRGTAQLLLDMGLVDEAKAVTSKWMARWIRM
jgi:monoamine oxidase